MDMVERERDEGDGEVEEGSVDAGVRAKWEEREGWEYVVCG